MSEKPNDNLLTASEVLRRREEANQNIANLCETPAGLIGVLIAVQEISDRQWKADKLRYEQLHK